MSDKIGTKIAKFAHDYRSRLLQEQGKTAAKMTKYDVALFMKKEGALTESEFNSWVKEKEGQDALQLSNQQKDAIKRGTIFSFTPGMQSYLDSDEVSDFTLGNVLGFERTTNEKTGATTIKSKAVSRKQFNVAEEMKKQSFYNYIKSLPTPQATYTELMRSIEFDKLDNKGKMEMMLKISGEKYNEAKEKGDKQAMKDYLLEGIGMALQLSCQKIDSTVGITQFKEWAKERSGLNFLVDLVDKYVDDGDEATLSWLEKNWEGVKGFGDALDSFIGTQAVAFIGTLELAGAAAGTGAIGQVFNAATKAYFLYDGGKMMVDGATRYYNAETKQEARQAGTEFGMGTVIFTGTLKSVIGEIQAFRANHSATSGETGLPELSEGHKAILEKNLPSITDNAQVKTDLAFLQQNGVEIVKFTPENGFDLIVNGKSMQLQPSAGQTPTFESGISAIAKQIKRDIVPPAKSPSFTETLSEIKEKIQDFSIPFRLKSKMHDEFHITGNQVYLRKFTEYEAEGLTREQMLHKFFQVETLSEEQIQQCYKWLDNIVETRAKIDKSFESVIPSLTPETYYRGIIEDADSRVMQIIQNAKVGDVIVPDEGYAWYSPKESYAVDYASNLQGKSTPETCVVMKIKTPAGAKLSRDISIDFSDGNIFGISGMNPYSSMNVVMQRGVRFEVLSKEVKDNKTYITLKYLGPKEIKSQPSLLTKDDDVLRHSVKQTNFGEANEKPDSTYIKTKLPIKELLQKQEVQDLLGYEIEVKFKSGRIRHMTAKEMLEKLSKQDSNLTMSVNDVIKMTNKVKAEQRIKTQEIVDIRNKFCSSKLNNALYDIECTLEFVKDEKILDFVKKELSDIKSLGSKKEAAERLKNVQLAIDAYNVAEGHYTYIGEKSNVLVYPEYREYLDFLDKDNNVYAEKLHRYPTFKEKYIKDDVHTFLLDKLDFLSEYRTKAAELQKNMRYTRLMEFCAKNPDSELSTHLYKEYYLKQAGIPKKIQEMCLNISEKYNTKLFLPKECKNTEQAIQYVEQELSAFNDAMKGSGHRLRHVIDFSELKENFEHKRSGKNGSSGYMRKDIADNVVNIPSMDIEIIQYALRHELMHTFDTKFGVSIEDIEITEVAFPIEDGAGNVTDLEWYKSSKYDDEFRNAGITDPTIIDYAYTNSKEFVAVASEGDMESYSEGFRQLLISKGMPEWAFKLRTINPTILENLKK